MTRINIKTKVISDNFRVYAIFPGSGYKHRQAMIERNLVFLDFPDLILPEDSAGYLRNEFTHDVARSEAISSWVSGGMMLESKPMMDIEHYRNTARGKKRGKYINSLEGLHVEAKKGELVIVPTMGYYGDIMIGEFVDNITTYVSPGDGYGEYKVPARKVRWIGKKPQYQVTEEFLKSIRTSNPLVIVKKSDRRQIYEAAYPSHMIGDEVYSTFKVNGETYTARDSYYFQEFLNYAAAVAEHICENRDGAIDQNITEAIWGLEDQSYIPELAININSPGLISLLSSKTTPLIASALFALAASSCGVNGEVLMPNSGEVIVSLANIQDDPCAIQVQRAVRHSLESMGYDEWQRMCRKIFELKSEPQISAPANVEN